MDLGTILAKLQAGEYKTRFDVEADFRLMIKNAQTYNPPGTYVHKQAKLLENIFRTGMAFTIGAFD